MKISSLLLSLALTVGDGESAAKRVYAHLAVRDTLSAVDEARRALVKYPESKEVKIALIRALAEKGEEMEAWSHWHQLALCCPDLAQDRSLLEALAWGVLGKGENSNQMVVTGNALIGAALTRDARAIPILINQMRGSNGILRAIGVKMASSYGDEPLCQEVLRMLKEEKLWYVRLEVIEAVGRLHLKEGQETLREIITHPKTSAEEKRSAIMALVEMYDKIEMEELGALITSNRAGLRQLACGIIAHFDLHSAIPFMLPLLKDHSPDVRMACLNTLGLMQVSGEGACLEDPIPEVAITAAWLSLIQGDGPGGKKLIEWIEHPDPQKRRLASAALAASGRQGVALAFKAIKGSKDPYVRANLAIGLIGQREHVSFASHVLYDVFYEEKETLWMWDHPYNPLFRSLAPSRVAHIDQVPHYPAVVDQLVRLEVLGVLSIVRYPKAQEAVKGFLKERSWGVAGNAAATLLQEGDEAAIVSVSDLLNDPDEKIRIQAALILALFGNDQAAVKVLQEAYPQADRELKIAVLEALARVGDPQTIPFLVEILKEPFQLLRVVAASALIQCLYH